eukprot:COSAG05_NODE_15163_length_377_cov_0.550360_1_plen_52_part_00
MAVGVQLKTPGVATAPGKNANGAGKNREQVRQEQRLAAQQDEARREASWAD